MVVCAHGGIRLALLSYDSLRICHARHQRILHVGRLFRTWVGLPRLGIAGPRADEEAQAPVSGFACASREVEAHGERDICECAMVLDCAHLDLMPAYAQVPLIAPGCCHSADPMTENGPISSDCARWICTVAT